ncbi:peptidase family M13 [Apiospora saccharicola]|uniref:Peptidase family M13 n=1 Tax=Apiospora saccharicola TaxID=335842 RepID=A0ABR1W1W1_9PEZI
MADPGPTETRNEATPLIGGRHGTQDPEAVASSEDCIQTEQQVKTWRRRRWVSLVASISLLIAFVVILILGGGLFP